MTIHQLSKPCFILDPSPRDDDAGEPHYATWHEADDALRELREERGPSPEDLAELEPVKVKALPGPCWVAECDAFGCDEQYEDDEDGGNHFGSVAELEEWIAPAGWTTDIPDKVYCRPHSAEGTPPPPSPAELEAAGQLRLLS
jgi:hypothetical protein